MVDLAEEIGEEIIVGFSFDDLGVYQPCKNAIIYSNAAYFGFRLGFTSALEVFADVFIVCVSFCQLVLSALLGWILLALQRNSIQSASCQ